MTAARHALQVLAGLAPGLVAAPTLACPTESQYYGPGVFLTLPLSRAADGARRPLGVGLELSWNCWIGGDPLLAGGLAQAEFNLEGRPRFAVAAQGAALILGAEAGLAYTGGDDDLSGLGAHVGAFFSGGVVWSALRITFGADAIYADLVTGGKFPIARDGQLFEVTSGRPVRLEGHVVHGALLAGTPQGGWRTVALDALNPLARAWAQDALAEQASVVAFQKLAAELASLGAPPRLLARLRAAAAEEQRHADDAFALASRHCGHPLTAGPLPCPPSEADAERLRARLIAEAFADGLIGEAAAAHRAAVGAAHATCRQARAALLRVARDEARHAALGSAILEECLRTGGSAARDALADAARAAHPDPETRGALSATEQRRHDAHGQPAVGPDRRWVQGARRHADRLLRAA